MVQFLKIIRKKNHSAKQPRLVVSAEAVLKRRVTLPSLASPTPLQNQDFWKVCQSRHPRLTIYAQHVVDVAGERKLQLSEKVRKSAAATEIAAELEKNS